MTLDNCLRIKGNDGGQDSKNLDDISPSLLSLLFPYIFSTLREDHLNTLNIVSVVLKSPCEPLLSTDSNNNFTAEMIIIFILADLYLSPTRDI